MDFSYLSIDLVCPKCGFSIEILYRQITAEETIICLGCLEEIQLVDDGGSGRRLESDLNDGLDQLGNLFN